MPAAPALAIHARGGRIAARWLCVRAGALAGGAAAVVELPWSQVARAAGFALEISVETFGARACISAVVTNPGAAPQALGGVVLGFEWSAPGSGALCFLRNGSQSESESGPQRLDAGSESGESHQLCAVGVAEGGPCALIGAYECGRSFARATARGVPGGAEIDLELCVDAELAPGERRALETVEVAVGDDMNALLEGFAARWGRAAGARTCRPLPTGWRSGHAHFSDVSEDSVRRALDALLAADLPIEVVQLDDGYQRAVGDWLATSGRFPRGLEALALDIRAAGFVPGLWTAPLCAEAESDLYRAQPQWFPRVLEGAHSLRWRGRSGFRRLFALDTGHDDVIRHLEGLYRTLVGWGYFHLELDALGVAARGVSSDRGLGAAARARRDLAAVRRGAGDEAFLLASGWPLGPAVGLVDGMRIAPDPALSGARASALARLWMHRRLWLNDPGPLPDVTGSAALPHGARRAWAALIAESGGIAFLSGELAAVSAEERARLREMLADVRALDTRGVPGVARVARPLDRAAPPQVVRGEPTRLTTSPLAVFCDFDGTFSVQDVGSSLAVRYAADRRPVQWARYERGEITPWQYNLEILEGLPVGTNVLDAFLATVELDPGARDLLAWCDSRHVPFRILSDGFDWNLNRLQCLHEVRFAYTANHLRVEHGRWRIRAGAPDPTCGCGTGTCKRGILRAYRAARPGAHLVHIGNGRVSDTCGALAADTAFAKDSLAESLERSGAPFVRFATLRDVIPHLAALLIRLAPT